MFALEVDSLRFLPRTGVALEGSAHSGRTVKTITHTGRSPRTYLHGVCMYTRLDCAVDADKHATKSQWSRLRPGGVSGRGVLRHVLNVRSPRVSWGWAWFGWFEQSSDLPSHGEDQLRSGSFFTIPFCRGLFLNNLNTKRLSTDHLPTQTQGSLWELSARCCCQQGETASLLIL